jgi:hypothetical protein
MILQTRLSNRHLAIAIVASLVAAIVSLGGWASLNRAQAQTETAETTIRVPLATLELPVALPERPEVETLGEAIGHLDIYIDGHLCGRLDLTDESHRDEAGGARTVVSAENGEACIREGAEVVFVDGNGLTLHEKFTLRPGEEIVVANLAPEPPHSGGGPTSPGAPATGSGLVSQSDSSPGAKEMLTAFTLLVLAGTGALALRRRRA